MNVGRPLDPAVDLVPERIALIVGDRRCSYRDSTGGCRWPPR